MQTTTLKLVTIIAEHVLQERLIKEIKLLGARGYTLSEVRGEGTRGIHASDWQGGNLKIETLVAPDVADLILERLADAYFTNYAVIVYAHTVDVIRGGKFVKPA
jgi:nitrogen regulatory protein P-II 2